MFSSGKASPSFPFSALPASELLVSSSSLRPAGTYNSYDLTLLLVTFFTYLLAPLGKTHQSDSASFGRRVCPGQHVANRSVLINCAMLLWAFKISKKKKRRTRHGDGDGGGEKDEEEEEEEEIDIDPDAFTSTANSHPLPFSVAFEARQTNLRALLE